MQRYREEKTLACGKDSIPLRGNVIIKSTKSEGQKCDIDMCIKNDTGCPNKHGSVYFMKTVKGCWDVSWMSLQDDQKRRTKRFLNQNINYLKIKKKNIFSSAVFTEEV